MASKKSKKTAKKVAKPEYTLKASPKIQTTNKVVKKPKVEHKKRQLNHKQKVRLFIAIIVLVVVGCFVFVTISVVQTNRVLDRAAKTADQFVTTTAQDTANAKISGSNEQLSKEIDNYESAPADLQQYALLDYRKLKQKCIVNGQVYGSLSYAIASVADDEYAQIKRNCNGAQTQILKKFGEKWTVVHEGNDPPLCDLVNDLMIPQRVSLNCVIGGTTYLNPNP